MKTTAQMLEKFHRSQEFGILVAGDACPDMQGLSARKEKVIQDQRRGILKLLDQHNVKYLKGQGYIENANLASVRLPDDKTLEVPWDKLILALGSRPLNIPSFPFDGQRLISSNEALYLSEVPKSILVVGGGVIGCEFAFIFSSLGSEVSIVEALPRLLPLPSVDSECSRILQREMKKRKIKFHLNRTLQKLKAVENRYRVKIGPSADAENLNERDRNPYQVEVEKVLICIGRKPNTDGIGLKRLGVGMDKNGWIIANEHMETTVQNVYAIGDVLGPSKIMLAHVASTEGSVAAENAMGKARTMNYRVVPTAIFTMPEIATVGLTEDQAREQGFSVRSDSVLFRNIGKPQIMGEIAGQAKIVSDAKNGKILGVHIVGPHATDLIAEGALAMQMDCSVRDLAETIHAHPTLGEVMLEVSYKALDRPLHG